MATDTLRQCVHGATTTITPTHAHPMATMALAGLSEASSSAPAPGITVIGDAVGTMVAVGTMAAAGTAVELGMLAPVTASTTELLATQAADTHSWAAAAVATTVEVAWAVATTAAGS